MDRQLIPMPAVLHINHRIPSAAAYHFEISLNCADEPIGRSCVNLFIVLPAIPRQSEYQPFYHVRRRGFLRVRIEKCENLPRTLRRLPLRVCSDS